MHSVPFVIHLHYSTLSHKNRSVVCILSKIAILAVLSDVKIVLEQVKQIRAADASLSSTAVDIPPITNSIMTKKLRRGVP